MDYKLTQYSHGAGCGCKISPQVLGHILKQESSGMDYPGLLVGNDKRDDAAVLDLKDGSAVISTTDFFMPIVDDAFDFGRIASVNAISDVYAMGGTPILGIAILGWPVDKLPPEVANRVIEGARAACMDAGIPLAGGHSIDSPEPIFGLAVTGRVQIDQLKKNEGARPGDFLFLTKPLGVGILTTATKKGKLQPEHENLAKDSMVQLNHIGTELAKFEAVHAMTDVTGFGLLGHLSEMAEASGVSAQIFSNQIPTLDPDAIQYYLAEKCVPGGTHRNWESYGHQISPIRDDHLRYLLCDPQTSGGLLVAVDPGEVHSLKQFFSRQGLGLEAIGKITGRGKYLVEVS